MIAAAILMIAQTTDAPKINTKALSVSGARSVEEHTSAVYALCSWVDEQGNNNVSAFRAYAKENNLDQATISHLVHDCSLSWKTKGMEDFKRIPMPRPKPRP